MNGQAPWYSEEVKTLVLALVGLVGAVSSILSAIAYGKIMEVRARVKDVQHKVGADQRKDDH